jgi:hypothetical protein
LIPSPTFKFSNLNANPIVFQVFLYEKYLNLKYLIWKKWWKIRRSDIATIAVTWKVGLWNLLWFSKRASFTGIACKKSGKRRKKYKYIYGVDKLEFSCDYCGQPSSPAIKAFYRVVLYKLIIYSAVEEILLWRGRPKTFILLLWNLTISQVGLMPINIISTSCFKNPFWCCVNRCLWC